ncbi:hypothetical protein ACLBYN_64955, partial [Pseudomonas aeruginosa]
EVFLIASLPGCGDVGSLQLGLSFVTGLPAGTGRNIRKPDGYRQKLLVFIAVMQSSQGCRNI